MDVMSVSSQTSSHGSNGCLDPASDPSATRFGTTGWGTRSVRLSGAHSGIKQIPIPLLLEQDGAFVRLAGLQPRLQPATATAL